MHYKGKEKRATWPQERGGSAMLFKCIKQEIRRVKLKKGGRGFSQGVMKKQKKDSGVVSGGSRQPSQARGGGGSKSGVINKGRGTCKEKRRKELSVASKNEKTSGGRGRPSRGKAQCRKTRGLQREATKKAQVKKMNEEGGCVRKGVKME